MSVDIKHPATDRFRFIAGVIAVVLCLSACTYYRLKEYGENVVQSGDTIDGLRERYGTKVRRATDPNFMEKPDYYLPNGNAVYIEPIVAGKDFIYIGCDNHWEINPQGRVVGFRTVGPQCKRHGGRNDQDPRTRGQ